jgi:hypothetical protein
MSNTALSLTRVRVAALIGVMACAAHVEAQAPERQDSLRRRIHALDSIVMVRKNAVDSVRRSLVRAVPTVSVSTGSLSVRTTPELEPRVRAAVALASKVIDDAGSSALPEKIASHIPVVVRDSTPTVMGFVPVISVASDTASRWYAAMRLTASVTSPAPHIADRLSIFIEKYALQGVDSSLAAWVMMQRLPLRPTAEEFAADVYVEVAANESVTARQCRAGATAACLDVFGLDSSDGSRLSRWYSAEDYRSLLRRVAPPRDDSVAATAWLRCREDHDQDACVVAAHALPNSSIPFPFSGPARFTLLREAFEIGGAGAYDRLIAPNVSVRARIEAAAGKPIDVVIQRWLARVEQSRPNPMKIRVGATIASLGWCGLFLAVAITRRRSCV